MRYRFVGEIAGTEQYECTAVVTYLDDYRDPSGQLAPTTLAFRKPPGGQWIVTGSGEPAEVFGPDNDRDPRARVRVTYVVVRPYLPPFGRSVERLVWPNTTTPGFWDFTIPSSQQPAFQGGPGHPSILEVLPGQGPRGERGTSWLHGRGAPFYGLGLPGDLYLDLTSWDVYTKSPDWTLAGNIRGGQGGVGARGPRGADGKSMPLPTPDQMGYVPVADGSQPLGFSWKNARTLGLKLRDLVDVDTLGLSDGNVLIWDATLRKWKPGTASTGGPTDPDPTPTPDEGGQILLQNGAPPVTVTVRGPDMVNKRYVPTFMMEVEEYVDLLEVFVRHPTESLAVAGLITTDPQSGFDEPPVIPQESALSMPGSQESRAYLRQVNPGTYYLLLMPYATSPGDPMYPQENVQVNAQWGSMMTGSFSVITDEEGFEIIDGARAQWDEEMGYVGIANARVIEDQDGFELIEEE